MSRLTIDTTQARSFDPVEPGPYPMTVDEFGEPYRSEEKNTLCVEVNFKFDDPALDQKAGRVRKVYPLEGKGAGFFRELWKAATGVELPIGEQTIDVETEDALGRPVLVQVGNEPYQGRINNTVERVAAAG